MRVLIVEDEPPSPIAQNDGLRAESGTEAVNAAENVRDYTDASTTTQVRSQEVRYVGDKTFFLRDGLWMDSQFDEGRESQTYRYGSSAYFDLLRQQPHLGRFMALGTAVMLRSGDEQIRIAQTPTIVEAGETLPAAASLRQNFPNPFNPTTTIRFEVMDASASVSLVIYDIAGQRVRELVRARHSSEGPHEVIWNGRDEEGDLVANGVYLYQLRAGEFRQVRRMVLVK